MKKISPSIRQILVFMGVFLASSLLFAELLRFFLNLLGWSDLPIEQFIAENKAGVQIASIAAGFAGVYSIEKIIGTHALKSVTRLGFLSADQASYSFLVGFLVAASIVAVSTFLGFSKVESPDLSSLPRTLWLVPWFLYQSLYGLLWLFSIELLRHVLFRDLYHNMPSPIVAVLFAVVFESHLLYSIAQSFSSQKLSLVAVVFCVSLSLTLNLTYLLSMRKYSARSAFFARLFFLWGFLVAFLNVFGQAISSWRATSLMQLFPGPLGVDPMYLYLAIVVIVANTALQRLLKHNLRQA